MTYPEYARIGDKTVKLRTDYRVALRCFSAVNDPDISDGERALAVIWLLFGQLPDGDLQPYLDKARLFLQCGRDTENAGGVRDMDMAADMPYIYASFLSDYRIDLDTTPMHWWRFCALMEGLTEECVLSRVRELRRFDLSEIKDAKTRRKIADAQQRVALPVRLTAEERDAIAAFERECGGGKHGG